MKARIYQTRNGYEVVNTAGELYALTKAGTKYITRACGTVGEQWQGSGALVRKVPGFLKKTFFSLNKKTDK